jgi:putative membrane protein insertion efficiency factor
MEINSLMSKLALIFIKIYRRILSPLMPPACRFYPSCSEYAEEAIKKYRLKGIFLSIKRILKCHPFHPGGYDPLR